MVVKISRSLGTTLSVNVPSQPTARLVGFRDLTDSFGAQGDNFFAVKVSYWIPVN